MSTTSTTTTLASRLAGWTRQERAHLARGLRRLAVAEDCWQRVHGTASPSPWRRRRTAERLRDRVAATTTTTEEQR